LDLDSQIALTFFKMNKEKFNPLKQIKSVQPQPPKLEDNSTLKGSFPLFNFTIFQEFEFLTGVNLQGVETYRDEQEDENKEINEIDRIRENFKHLNSINNKESDPPEQTESPKETKIRKYVSYSINITIHFLERTRNSSSY